MPVFIVEVDAVDSWVYNVRADTQEEAEKAALRDFRKTGGHGLEYEVQFSEELENPYVVVDIEA